MAHLVVGSFGVGEAQEARAKQLARVGSDGEPDGRHITGYVRPATLTLLTHFDFCFWRFSIPRTFHPFGVRASAPNEGTVLIGLLAACPALCVTVHEVRWGSAHGDRKRNTLTM